MNKAIKLPNGIEIVNIYDNSPLIKLRFLFKVGSRHEEEGNYGLAHFLEHMMYEGTLNKTQGQIERSFKDLGGVYNAFTTQEYTLYTLDTLVEDMHKGWELMSDILCNPAFKTQCINKERKVVLQEMQEAIDTQETAFEEFKLATIFDGQTISNPIIGFEEDVNAIRREDFVKFYNRFYCKENLRLIVIGKLTTNETIQLTKQYLKALPRGKKAVLKPSEFHGGYNFIKNNINSTTVELCFGNKHFYPSKTEFLVLEQILSERVLSKTRKKGLVYNSECYADLYSDCYLFGISGRCSPQNVNELVDLFIFEANRIKAVKVSKKELDLAKKSLKILLTKTMNDKGLILESALQEEDICKIEFDPAIYFEKINNIKAKQLQELASKLLLPENLAYIVESNSKKCYSFKQVQNKLSSKR